jgi:putative FmdB family regulatory protein
VPTYQYTCTDCGHDLEVVQKFTDDALTECPACTGKLRKIFSAVGVQGFRVLPHRQPAEELRVEPVGLAVRQGEGLLRTLLADRQGLIVLLVLLRHGLLEQDERVRRLSPVDDRDA